MLGDEEWRSVPSDTPHIEKIDDLKFLACPLSVITGDTWELLRDVRLHCDSDGNIRHLPEPDYPLKGQSPRFLAAVEMMQAEKNSHWFRELQKTWAKKGADK